MCERTDAREAYRNAADQLRHTCESRLFDLGHGLRTIYAPINPTPQSILDLINKLNETP